MIRLAALALAVSVTVGAPGLAGAATASFARDALRYDAGPGESNRVTIVRAGDHFRISDPGAVISAGAGCAALGASEVTCAATGAFRIEVSLGDGDDFAALASAVEAEMSGGSGADTLEGGEADDLLRGEEGDDTLAGGLGADQLEGGPGGDMLSGGDGFLPGASDEELDVISYESRSGPVTVDLDGVADDGEAGEGDNVMPDVEVLVGTAKGDVLIGSPGENFLVGGAGSDVLRGEGGIDLLFGDTGESLGALFESDEGGGEARAVARALPAHAGRILARAAPAAPMRGRGNDTLIGGGESDFLLGEDGNDVLRGDAGVDILEGGRGADRVSGGTGPGRPFGEARGSAIELDLVFYPRTRPLVVDLDGRANDGEARERDNVLADVEAVFAGSGSDRLRGNGKANWLSGGRGHDVIRGGAGDDRLIGGSGDDALRAGPGRDRARGGAGHDLVVGGPGADSLRAGDGDDHVLARDDTPDRVDGGPGSDRGCLDPRLDRVRSLERLCGRARAAPLAGRARR